MKSIFTLLLIACSFMVNAQIEENTGTAGRDETVGISALDYSFGVDIYQVDESLIVSTDESNGFSDDILLYNLSGSVVIKHDERAATQRIDVSSLNSGIYLLHSEVNQQPFTRRVFIR